jgi:hypothetical protein
MEKGQVVTLFVEKLPCDNPYTCHFSLGFSTAQAAHPWQRNRNPLVFMRDHGANHLFRLD